MRSPALLRFSSLFLILSLLLACNLSTATAPQSDQQGPQNDGEVGPSATPPPQEPTEAPPPSLTPTPAVPTETPLPTDTPGPNFNAASIYAVSHLPGDRLMVTVQIPGGVQGAYRSTSATSNQTCEILPEYPDRLYCTGPEPFENYSVVSAVFRLFAEGQVQPVFESEFNIPPRATPTPTITPTPTFFIIITLAPIPMTLSP